jgi:hypothetical protein
MIDAMMFSDFLALFEYWRDNPPAHVLLKVFVGYKSKPKRGELNQHEQAALSASSTAVPAYVLDAMKAYPSPEVPDGPDRN